MRTGARAVGGFRLMAYRSPHLPWWSCQRYSLLISPFIIVLAVSWSQ